MEEKKEYLQSERRKTVERLKKYKEASLFNHYLLILKVLKKKNVNIRNKIIGTFKTGCIVIFILNVES